jgi:competence protein ComEA
LNELPGIGPALAERIVALRSERGPFRSVDELELVEGISERTVEQLRPLVNLGE